MYLVLFLADGQTLSFSRNNEGCDPLVALKCLYVIHS